MKFSVGRVFACAAAALALAGCVVVPTPVGKGRILYGAEVKEADLKFLQPAKTTKAEVTARFGQPAIIWADENILVYRWVRQVGTLYWAIGAGYSGGAGVTDMTQNVVLLVQFDGADCFKRSGIIEKADFGNFGKLLVQWRDAQGSTARPATRPGGNAPETMVLFRVTTEVDGQRQSAFPGIIPLAADSIWLGLGDFSSGGALRKAPLKFFSGETRKEGWTYLMLPAGTYYLAAQTPQNGSAMEHMEVLAKVRPWWRLEVPENAAAIYGGTLFAPGNGSQMLFGGRRLRSFDTERVEVREERELAAEIQRKFAPDVTALETRLVKRHSSTEPIILTTPGSRWREGDGPMAEERVNRN